MEHAGPTDDGATDHESTDDGSTEFVPPKLDLVMIVASEDPVWCELIEHAAPEALRVVVIEDAAALALELATFPVLCGVVMDMDLSAPERASLIAVSDERWYDLPKLALMRNATTQALSDSCEHTSLRVFKQGPPEPNRKLVRDFLQAALTERLGWAAQRLGFARARGLAGPMLDTFTAVAIRQVQREELADVLTLKASSVPRRVRKLCEALGGGHRLGDLGLRLATIATRSAHPELVMALERRATPASR